MRKRWRAIIAAAALAAVLAATLFFSLRRSVNEAVEEARAERDARGPGAELVARVAWPARAVAEARSVTRLLPVNDAASWNSALVLATDGGLVIRREAGAARLTEVDGLPGTRINCLATWRDLLLVGSDDGVAALNEQEIRSYRFPNPRANKISALLARPDGVLIGTRGGGLIEYDGSAFRYFPGLADDPELMVSALCRFEDGLAVGTWKEGVIVTAPGGKLRIGDEAGVAGPVTALFADGPRLLIGTPLGLLSWQRGRPAAAVLDNLYVSSITSAGDEIVLASLSQGVVRIKDQKARKQPLGWSVTKVVALNQSLLALGERGVAELKGEGGGSLLSFFPLEAEALSDNRLTAVAAGPEGQLWVGTFERGVDVLGPDYRPAVNLAEPGFEAVNCVRASDREGLMYVGTSRGVLVYSGTRLADKITKEDGLGGESVSDVLALASGGLAIATNRGICFRDPAGLSCISAFHGLVNNHVYALAEFGDIMAAGTLGGLSLVKDRRVIASFTMSDSPLRHNWVNSLAAASGRLYIGTFGGGVAAMESKEKWDPSFSALGRADVNQNAFLVQGPKLLAGTFGAGLYEIDLATGEERALRGRLLSRNVTGLALWKTAGGDRVAIATDCGLSVVFGKEMFK